MKCGEWKGRGKCILYAMSLLSSSDQTKLTQIICLTKFVYSN